MNNGEKKIKVLIIDDEKLARDILKSYLKMEENIEIIGESENGFDGALAIKNLNPNLIFLDIQMPKLSGFEMLELIENPPMIIFTTAYDEFAIKAFDINALDYLLKPFSKERLAKALVKVSENFGLIARDNTKIKSALEYMHDQAEIINRLVVKVQNRIEIILVKDIEHIEAQDDYVFIYTVDEKRFIKEITMKYLEDHLNPKDFVRVHRSHFIRIDRISKIEQDESETYNIILKSQKSVSVSKSGYRKLKDQMGI